MKRIQILGIMLLALFAFSVVLASTASATVTFLLAEWLETGNPISAAKLVDMEGELNFINLNGAGLGIVVEILCDGILDGTAGPVSEDLITSLLTLAGVEIPGIPLTGMGLECANTKNCTEPLVWFEELPWKTELELMVEGTETFFADLFTGFKVYFECLSLGITSNELCQFPSLAAKVTNEAGGVVDIEFSDAFQELAELKLGECGGRAETFEVTGLLLGLLTGGQALTASSGA